MNLRKSYEEIRHTKILRKNAILKNLGDNYAKVTKKHDKLIS